MKSSNPKFKDIIDNRPEGTKVILFNPYTGTHSYFNNMDGIMTSESTEWEPMYGWSYKDTMEEGENCGVKYEIIYKEE